MSAISGVILRIGLFHLGSAVYCVRSSDYSRDLAIYTVLHSTGPVLASSRNGMLQLPNNHDWGDLRGRVTQQW